MADLKRDYIVPLRKECLKVPKYQRTKKSVKALRKFIKKHMKVDDVKILRELNLELHKHGRKNPPSKVAVSVIKVEEKDKTFVRVNLIGKSLEGEKKPEEKKKGLADKVKEKFVGKPKETKEEKHKKDEEKEKKEVLEHAKLERTAPRESAPVVKDKAAAQKSKMERIVTRDKKR